MKILKSLLEEVRAFNLDTDEELDLDTLADIDLDAILGGEYMDADGGDVVGELDFEDLISSPLDGEDFDIGFEDEANLGFDLDAGEEELDDIGLEDDLAAGEEEFDLDFDLNGDEELPFGEDEGPDSEDGIDGLGTEEEGLEEENPDFQGEIRTVRGANLVYKRKMPDGNFEELWIYNVGKDIKRETHIRRAILAGTDIDPGSQESSDGNQRAETSTTGNVQFLHIVGLPQ